MQINLDKEEKIISEFLRSIEEWKEYLIIGGGFAPIIYRLYFYKELFAANPIATRDIDTIIPRFKIKNISEIESIDKKLISHGFKHKVNDLLGNPSSEKYTKEINGDEIEIEFLTDNKIRKNAGRNLKLAGVVAQTLSYIEMSYDEPLAFSTKDKTFGLVVNPAAYIFHKALTFNKRNLGSNKHYKDLYGLWYVGTQMGHFSNEACIKLKEIQNLRKSWQKKMNSDLSKWIDDASPRDWEQLEIQDPSGELNKTRFIKFVRSIA